MNIQLLRIGAFAVLLAGCTAEDKGDPVSPGGGPAKGQGRILLAGGDPAVGARVRFFPVDHVPSPAAAKTAAVAYEARTDSEGRYAVDTLPPGEYNILAELDGALSLSDSVVVGRTQGAFPVDTLRDPGSLEGIVRLQPNHSPRTTTLQVLGTNAFVNVDREGRFNLANLAQGNYSLRLVTSLEEYSPLYVSVRIRSGVRDTLRTALVPDFSGIPVVTGLNAVYDTLAGKARLRWNAADYEYTEEYLVYRLRAGALGEPEMLVGRTRDTTFSDSLFDPRDLLSVEPRSHEYSVRLKNLSGEVGLRFGSVVVEAVPPRAVRTSSTLEASGGGIVGIEDSVRLDLAYWNPGRRIRRVEWYSDAGDLVRMREDSSLSGSDRLMAAWPQPGEREIRVTLVDEGGVATFDTVKVLVVLDVPRASAGADFRVAIKGAIRLRGSGADTYGTIRKLEWDIGATGRFTEVPGGDTTVQAPPVPDAGYMHVLRVTDNRGLIGLDTVRTPVELDAPRAEAGNDTLATIGSRFRLAGRGSDALGEVVKYEWDPGATGNFLEADSGILAVDAPASPDSAYLCVLRVTDNSGLTDLDTVRISVGRWRLLAAMPFKPAHAVVVEGNILALSAVDAAAAYSRTEDRWIPRPSPSMRVKALHLLQNSAVIYGETPFEGKRQFERWNPAANAWDTYGRHNVDFYVKNSLESIGAQSYVLEYTPTTTQLNVTVPPAQPTVRKHLSRAMGTSNIAFRSVGVYLCYTSGFNREGRESADVEVYDTLTGTWKPGANRPRGGAILGSLSHAGRWYVLGKGGSLDVYDPTSDAWAIRSSAPGMPADAAYRDLQFVAKANTLHVFALQDSRIEIWSYGIATDEWAKVAVLPNAGEGLRTLLGPTGDIFILDGARLIEYSPE